MGKEYHVGDTVDIKVNSAVQKGMPYRFYHGRTGKIYMVTKKVVGVLLARRRKSKMRRRFILARVEHIRHNKGAAIQRKKEELQKEYKEKVAQHKSGKGEQPQIPPELVVKKDERYPRPAQFVQSGDIVDVSPLPFEIRL